MKTNEKIMVELAVNFVARMVEHGFDAPNATLTMRKVRNERMIEFFTGAYVCARTRDDNKLAEMIGVYTKMVLATGGYERCKLLSVGTF